MRRIWREQTPLLNRTGANAIAKLTYGQVNGMIILNCWFPGDCLAEAERGLFVLMQR